MTQLSEYLKTTQKTEATINPESLKKIREKVHHPHNVRATHALFGLMTEVGELTDEFKKHIYYDKELYICHVKEEIGDIFYYLAVLLNTFNMNPEQVLTSNIEKLKQRYPEGFTEKDAVKRMDKVDKKAEEPLDESKIPQKLRSEKCSIKNCCTQIQLDHPLYKPYYILFEDQPYILCTKHFELFDVENNEELTEIYTNEEIEDLLKDA